MAENNQNNEKSMAQLSREIELQTKKIEKLKEEERLLREKNAIIERELSLYGKMEKKMVNEKEAILDMLVNQKDFVKQMETTVATREDVVAIVSGEKELTEKQNEALSERTKELIEQHNIIQENLKNLEESVDYREQILENQQITNIHAENHLEMLTGISTEWNKTALGSMAHAAQLGKLEERTQDYFETQMEAINAQSVGISIAEKLFEGTMNVARAQEQARASLASSTGMGNEYSATMRRVNEENMHVGVTADDASDSISAIVSRFEGFNELTEQSQKNMAANVALLDQMGVSADTTAQMYTDTNKALNMTVEETDHLTKRMAAMVGPGQDIQGIFNDFNQALPQLAQHGKGAQDVFMGLAAISKQTQVEMSELLGIAKQFDEFDSASKSVGKLNALLGGDYLNSVQMLAASEEERIGMMIKAMEQSGKNFDSMERYERMAIANAAGIDDMTTANKLLGQSFAEYQKGQKDAQTLVATQEEMNEKAQAAQTIWKNLEHVANSFAITLGPLIEGLNWFMQGIIELNSELEKASPFWADVFKSAVGLLGVMIAFKGVLNPVTSAVGGLVKAIGSSIAASWSDVGAKGAQQSANYGAGAAAGFAAKKMLAFAAAVALAGIGVGAAAAGIGYMAASLENLNKQQMAAAMILTGTLILGLAAFLGLMVALAPLIAGAVGPLLALGAALVLIGGAVFLAAAGLSMLFDSISALKMENANAFASIIASMMKLGAVAPLMAIASVALSGMAGSMALLGVAMNNIELTKLKEMSSLMGSIQKLNNEHEVVFTNIMKQYRQTIETQKSQGGGKGGVEKVIEAIIGGGGKEKAGKGGKVQAPLVIKLDGREMKKFIIETVNEEIMIRENN